jgi:glycosyltransferase involved in cell wall biosynthesis
MGRPLIASDVPGCRDVVDDGVNGILCAPHDAASLADAMRRFSTMRDKDRSTMGAAGRAKVQAQFSEERVIEAYLQALDDVIAPQV